MANKGFVPTFKDLYHAADGEQSNWKYGMFTDWCKDPWMALGSFFCMPCARGMLSEKTSTGDFFPSCLMNCFCPCFADCSHNIAARQQVRGEHGVEGTILEDFCLLSCRPCSAAQEFNQLGVTMDDVEKDVRRVVGNTTSSGNQPETTTHDQAFGGGGGAAQSSTSPPTAAAPAQNTMNAA